MLESPYESRREGEMASATVFCTQQDKKKLSFSQDVLWDGKLKAPCTSSYLLSVLGDQVSQGFHGDPGDPKTHNKHKTESKGDGEDLH